MSTMTIAQRNAVVGCLIGNPPFFLCNDCYCEERVKDKGSPEKAGWIIPFSQHCHYCGATTVQGELSTDRYKKPSGMVIVSYQDVLDHVEVAYDSDPMDWKEGWLDHMLIETSSEDRDRVDFYSDRRNYLIRLIEDPDCREEYEFARLKGASKQVAAEYARSVVVQRLETIKNRLENGVDCYCVHFDGNVDNEDSPFYGMDAGIMASVGSVEGYDYAKGECREEIAREAVAELERAGNLVLGQPNWESLDRDRRNQRMRANWEFYVRMFDRKGETRTGIGKRGCMRQLGSFGKWFAQHSL